MKIFAGSIVFSHLVLASSAQAAFCAGNFVDTVTHQPLRHSESVASVVGVQTADGIVTVHGGPDGDSIARIGGATPDIVEHCIKLALSAMALNKSFAACNGGPSGASTLKTTSCAIGNTGAQPE